MQLLFEHPESHHRLVVWPLDEEMAVMEMTDWGWLRDYPQIALEHRVRAEAQVRVLPLVNGFAEIVSPSEFESTNPRA